MTTKSKIQPTITITVEPEDLEVRGNALASGDDAADKACEDEILSRLDAGDVWAWARVTVRAEYEGFTGEAHLGGCSYADEDDFKRGGYYDDMVREATDDLRAELKRAVERGEIAKGILRKF